MCNLCPDDPQFEVRRLPIIYRGVRCVLCPDCAPPRSPPIPEETLALIVAGAVSRLLTEGGRSSDLACGGCDQAVIAIDLNPAALVGLN